MPPEDLSLQPLVKLALTIADDANTVAFDPDIARLFKGVRAYGSLNAAAKQAGMAYSKAWRLINNAEEAYGKLLLVRDGAHGSTLTVEGERLLDAYDELCERVESFATEHAAGILANL